MSEAAIYAAEVRRWVVPGNAILLLATSVQHAFDDLMTLTRAHSAEHETGIVVAMQSLYHRLETMHETLALVVAENPKPDPIPEDCHGRA